MKVAVRVRPLNQREINTNCSITIRVSGNDIDVWNAEGENRRFTFDQCFQSMPNDSSFDSQDKICNEVADDVIAAVSCGYNASVIACGQTGAGKTYTLLGGGTSSSCDRTKSPAVHCSVIDYGVSQVVGQRLLSLMECSEAVCQLEISFMEIFNDYVVDLLPTNQESSVSSNIKTALKVRDHPKRGVYVQGLSRRRVASNAELVDLMNFACSRRSMSDAISGNGGRRSLSHVIFAVYFTQAKYELGVPSEIASRVYFADIADRQPVYSTRASVDERKRADGINRSLANFNNVICALADFSSSESIRYGTKSRRRKSFHIPYGDSALTMLLKDSIGANSFSIFLAAVSPATCHYIDTLNTLKTASMVSCIACKPTVNEDQSVTRIKELWKEHAALRSAIADSSSNGRHRSFLPLKQFLEVKEKLRNNEEWIRILTSKWITRWLASVKNERHHYETVLNWQGLEKSRSTSGADSALGSDVEVERDSKSLSDDGHRLGSNRRSAHQQKTHYSTTNGSIKRHRTPDGRYRCEIVLGLVGNSPHPQCDEDSVDSGDHSTESLPQPQLLASASADQRIRRLERDKAVARITRMKLRNQQQQLLLRRRADSQPNVVRQQPATGGSPLRAIDDMANVVSPGDKAIVADKSGLPKYLPIDNPVVSQSAAVQENVETQNKKAAKERCFADTEEGTSLPLMTHLFGHVADQLGHVRTAVCDVLQSRYDYFTTLSEKLGLESINRLSGHVDGLQPVIAYMETIVNSGSEDINIQEKYRERLAHYRRLMFAVNKYIDINRLLNSIDADLRKPVKVYTTLVDDLDRLDAVLSTLDREHPLEKQSLYVLQIEAYIMRQRVLKEIDDAWNELISWELPPYGNELAAIPDGENHSFSKSFATLNLSGVGNRRAEDINNIATASTRLGRFDAEVSAFCKHLLDRLIRRVTANETPVEQTNSASKPAERRRVVKVDEKDTRRTISIVPNPDGTSTRGIHSTDELVFEQLEQIFDFLDRALSGVKITVVSKSTSGGPSTSSSPSDSSASGEVVEESLMQKIGEVAISRILDCIYVDCLSNIVDNVPSTTDDDFSKLDQLTRRVERFEQSLRRHLKVKEKVHHKIDAGKDVVSIVGKVREACGRAGAARCGRLLAETHALVVSDVSTTTDADGRPVSRTITVSARSVLGERLLTDYYETLEQFVIRCREETKTVGYRLPTCRISTSVRDFVCLIYNTLRQSTEATNHSAQILHNGICQIVELFCDLEPYYHQDLLATSPRHAAVHHNNCMYLAHHLITVERMFARRKCSTETSAEAKLHANFIVTDGAQSISADVNKLPDLVSSVKRLGNDYFTRHINIQKRKLCDLLASVKGFSCIADDDGAGAQQVLQLTLNYLKSVATSWRDVLPLNAYCRSVGSLLNTVLREIIAHVINVSEYSVEDCECLQLVLNSIADRIIANDQDAVFPVRIQSPDDDAEVASLLQNGAALESPKPQRKIVVVDGVQLQQPVDMQCPIEVILERCVPAWPKFMEVVKFFGLGLAGVAERWADGNGPLALHATGLEVAQLVEAVFERTSRRDAFVHQLRSNPSGRPPTANK